MELRLSEGAIRAKSVVVASGARYKRLGVSDIKSFEGDSIHYWASPAEANLCSGEEVAVVGGGNSAGQAAVFLSSRVKHLTIIVRGRGLEASMSRYLIDRIKMLENVDVLTHSEVAALDGARLGALQGILVRTRSSPAARYLAVRHLFMFIGAEPNTTWLNGCVTLDEKGYILTGLPNPRDMQAPVRYPLQTSLSRVFAIGDVRSGSIKRVASAVGEGAAVVAQIHSLLNLRSAHAC